MLEIGYNSVASDYIIDTSGLMSFERKAGESSSNWIVRYLMSVDKRISKKEFKQNLLRAIARDALEMEYGEKYTEKFLRRLNKWCKKKDYKRHLYNKVEILESLNNDRVRFVPDAHLIDFENKTIVCYELEDKHPLNQNSIAKYSTAWWALEYIYWDLQLIGYDIYGNHRIIQFPLSSFINN